MLFSRWGFEKGLNPAYVEVLSDWLITIHITFPIPFFWCSPKLCSCNYLFKMKFWSWHQKKPSDGFIYSGTKTTVLNIPGGPVQGSFHLPLWFHLWHPVDWLTLWGMKSPVLGAFSSVWDTLAIHSTWLFLSLWLNKNSQRPLSDTNNVLWHSVLFLQSTCHNYMGVCGVYVYLISQTGSSLRTRTMFLSVAVFREPAMWQ